ncbi:MAG: 3-dehydroquinate synthase II [Candidatus Aureabacteria bacterium]|nr:3-dehydroquinate synthase II [Candidatus Auribacterota bacterium]
MKKFFVSSIPFNKDIVTTAIESGAHAILVEKGMSSRVSELGVIDTIAPDGTIVMGKDIEFITISSKENEIEASKKDHNKLLVISTDDWTIIPLENLIAQRKNLIAEVTNSEEAKTALSVLEKGTDGILLKTQDLSEIKKVSQIISASTERFDLIEAKITAIKKLGMGDRVCIDTSTNLLPGEGMLIGNTSLGSFLVHSESIDNPYVEKRPFRVNAGGVHAYIKVPGDRTKYLSEIKSGDTAMAVKADGSSQEVIVGRTKLEKRPMMLIEATAKDKNISLILQNAETIRLVTKEGLPVSVVNLKEGDNVLAFVEESGRHFGIKIKEHIVEE